MLTLVGAGATPVDCYQSGVSPYGVYDMCGNVWEWCSTETRSGRHELKGGAWTSPFNRATPSAFNDAAATICDDDTGVPLLGFIERSEKSGRTLSLSIAAFGRMFAFRPELQNEAAIQRGHAFTTHAADIEPDYFTAVNDLSEDGEGRGAGHLAINQFTGGVYYWHCNIDRRQLWTTWIVDTDEATTRARLTSLFAALLIDLPSGKQTTTAYKTLPDAILAVEATAPVALHQAFESPVQADGFGYREPSLKALLNAQTRLARFTPSLFGRQRLATVLDSKPPEDVVVEQNLDTLIEACVSWVLAGRAQGRL